MENRSTIETLMVSQKDVKNMTWEFTGKSLLAWGGFCRICSLERRIYWLQCNKKRRRQLEDDDFMKNEKFLCENCSLKSNGPRYTGYWSGKLSKYQAQKDLQILEKSVNIDYGRASNEAYSMQKKDSEADEFLARSDDLLDFVEKRKTGNHKIISYD